MLIIIIRKLILVLVALVILGLLSIIKTVRYFYYSKIKGWVFLKGFQIPIKVRNKRQPLNLQQIWIDKEGNLRDGIGELQ